MIRRWFCVSKGDVWSQPRLSDPGECIFVKAGRSQAHNDKCGWYEIAPAAPSLFDIA